MLNPNKLKIIFETLREKCVACYDSQITCVLWEIKIVIYICVGDSTHKLRENTNLIWIKTNDMFRVEWVNDMNQELKIQKTAPLVQISDLG